MSHEAASSTERHQRGTAEGPEKQMAGDTLARIADTLPRLLRRQVARDPEAPALVCGAETLSYAELDLRTNRLAHLLIDRGTGPGDLVALHLQRGTDFVLSALAAVKAGAAFLPVDPAYPAERVAYVLGDARPQTVVTADAAPRGTPDPATVLTVGPDGVTALAADRPGDDPVAAGRVPAGQPGDAAYVIYTSGSSGRPKGVVVPHNGLAFLAEQHVSRLGAGPGSRVLQFASPSFDASVFELSMALLTGGTLVLAAQDRLEVGPAFAKLLTEERITHVTLPPAVLATLPDKAVPPGVTLVTAGEACSARVAARWATDRLMVNGYGPTETTVCATMSAPLPGDGTTPDIGGAVVGTRVHVLDDRLRPVSDGVPGELYVAGESLAIGYLHRPALTAERFVADPFGPPGSRLYRTGDMVERSGDGTLRYRGRSDDQVKIRGFRVELGEVEAAALTHPDVAEAAAGARDDDRGHRRLVVYVRAEAGRPAPDRAALAAHLGATLPGFMLPSAVVPVSRFPLGPTGKVDRGRLPAPDWRAAAGAHVPAADRTEETVAALWAEVLGTDVPGMDDDFLDLGGDSLLAVRVLARLRAELGVRLSPRDLFTAATPRGLADLARNARDTGAAAGPGPAPVADDHDAAPMSFAQEGLWFLHDTAPEQAGYGAAVGIELRGALDEPALRSALRELTARHPVLRTTFRAREDLDGRHPHGAQGTQLVHPPTDPVLAVADLRDLPADRVAQERERLVAEETARSFDLVEGPLLRTLLLRLPGDHHLLVLNQHHIVTDGWSARLLTGELLGLYESAAAGEEFTRPDPAPAPYQRYARIQREHARTGVWDEDLAYWRRAMAELPTLDLPTDRPRSAAVRPGGALHRFTLPADVVTGLRALSRERRATLFTTLLAGVHTVLAQHSGQDDFVLGTAASGRGDGDWERTPGFFVNLVPLRNRLDARRPFADFLDAVRDTTLEALEHAAVPFDRLVDALHVRREPGRMPLVQTVVSYQEPLLTPHRRAGLEVAEAELPRSTARFDLLFEFWDHGQKLAADIEYSTALFDAATVERLADHLTALLRAAVAAPATPAGRLLPAGAGTAEEQAAARRWNDTAVDYPRDRCVHELFEEVAAARPDQVALVFQDDTLTYGALDARANQLAHRLAEEGIGRGSLVPVCAERGPDLVTGLLAVLKAGGAYALLDMGLPRERLHAMLQDLDAPVALVQDHLGETLRRAWPADRPCTLLPLGADGATDRQPTGSPGAAATATDPATVMFTSGSTGRPKGVVAPHRALVRTFVGTEFVRFGPDEVIIQSAPVSWDAFLLELFGALLHGARCVLQPGPVPEPEAIAELVERHAVTTLWLSSSLFNVMAEEYPGVFDRLRQVMTGGEAVSVEHAARVLRRVPGLCLVNGYGPVESMVFATSHRVRPADLERASVPIGRPIANTRVYVLDTEGRPVPDGIPGELYIGGDGLATGYLHQPGLTAERFAPAAFGPDERLYRTGDLARRLPTGELEFLGRADDQVKIRGFRIEPGEIVRALLRHPGIADAAVTATAAGTDRRLVAHVVPKTPGTAPDAPELRLLLGESLPSYMVPAAFVTLDALPLTAAGKLDRGALPVPAADAGRPARPYVAPRDDRERLLADLWCRLLDVERVGVEDNFFELGGDSILTMRVAARARAEGFALRSGDVLRHQTVAALAAAGSWVRDTGRDAEQSAVEGDVPLSPIQRWFFGTATGRVEHFDQTVRAELDAAVDGDALETALRSLTTHHDALRLRFTEADGGFAHNAPEEQGSLLRHEDLSRLPADQQNARIAEVATAEAAFDLATGPLLTGVLFRLGAARRPHLVLAAHHLVVDGVSWRILLEDLATAYGQAVAGEQVALGHKTTSFRSWATDLAARTRAGAFEAERGHWEELLAGDAPGLPRDFQGRNTAGSLRTLTVRLGRAESEALLREVPALYRAGADDVLLAALGAALADWTGRDRFLVDLEGHGREEEHTAAGLSRTVGWFTSLYPVALRPAPPALGWPTAIKSMKEQLRAVPGAGLGYGALREAADHRAERHRTPEISFNYLGRTEALPGGGLFAPGAHPELWLRQDPEHERPHLIDVIGSVRDGSLELLWQFSDQIHREETVRALADRMTGAVRAIAAHRDEPGAGGRTPSDFPLLGLDQASVDLLAGDGRTVEDLYPLTPMQAGMLFHSLEAGERGAYVAQISFRLDGVGRTELLARAWQLVVDRTPVLRTTFVEEGAGEPVQRVLRHMTAPLRELDWTGLPEQERSRALRDLFATERERGFDLAAGPLTRLTAARTDGRTLRLMWTFHHALLDGWSLYQVLADLFTTYAALLDPAAGSDAPGTPRPPFSDYVRWLSAQDDSAARRHFTEALAGLTTPTALPYDRRPGAAHQPRSTARLRTELPAELSRRVYALARTWQVTANTVVQGAWSLLLARLSGQPDVCFGSTVSGRPAELDGAQDMIGLFINTLPVRVSTDGTGRLGGWLQEIQRRQSRSREFGHLSLPTIQSCGEIESPARLFDSVLVFENYPVDEAALAGSGLRMGELTGDAETTNYPLVVGVYPQERMAFSFAYDPELFDEETVAGLSHRLGVLLEGFVDAEEDTGPGQGLGPRLARLPWLSAAERHELLVTSNDTGRETDTATVVQRIARQARRTPEAVAVRDGGHRLRYAELAARSDALAARLVAAGVGSEDVVAVGMSPSADLLVALLAVWKAGAAYTPLDLAHPAHRLATLLTESGAVLALADPGSAELLRPLVPAGCRLEVLEQGTGAAGERPADGPTALPEPGQAAYVLYTSGSTGLPKGVVIEHGALAHYVDHSAESYTGLRGASLLHSSLAFDLTVTALWTPLTLGGEVVVAGLEHEELERLAATGDLPTFVKATPAHLALLDQLPDASDGSADLVVGGEQLPSEALDGWRARHPGSAVINEYGPTEATVGCVIHRVEPGEPLRPGPVPIGFPIRNTQIYVLDELLQPVPVGAAGELYLGGRGLARGYRRSPGRTAERFVASPFGAPGSRLYRTGDLVRRRTDGALEYIGRTDDQVKVRGFRVELGDVESAVIRHPDLTAAAVVLVGGSLVAHVVPVDGAAPEEAQIRTFLSGLLPEHMVPARVVRTAALPLTPNGKVDRKALREVPAAAPGTSGYVAPRTPTEQALAGIWSEVLGVEKVGATDDFVTLGGDSIRSLAVMAQVRTAFRVRLTPREALGAGTIADLAAVVEEKVLRDLMRQAAESGYGGNEARGA
ncbi:amino acid adenylation domain-containing protein [Kitasatospora albolonga]